MEILEQSSLKKEFLAALNLDNSIKSLIEKPLSRILAIDSLEHWYQQARNTPGANFIEQIIKALNISASVAEYDLNRIPKAGSCIIVANHPFGGIEGIIITSILVKIRRDIKILANHYLRLIPELRDLFIFVDPFGKSDSNIKNIIPLKQAIQWIKKGGLLVVFPAGAVSHFKFTQGVINDPPWQENIGRLIEISKATVVPVFFRGSNRLPFQTFGMIHPLLRTLRLPKELLNKQNISFEVSIGAPISEQKLNKYPTPAKKLNYLRKRTYNLANRYLQTAKPQLLRDAGQAEIAALVQADELLKEIQQLPKFQFLYHQNGQDVFFAYADQIPNLLIEIARQREITFRDVGEGTGKSLDLDQFDNYYLHLVAWNSEHNQLVGAYRLGLLDVIMAEMGKKGLYSHTLFKIKKSYLKKISPAIELGRSFVVKEYQKNFSSLFLLWRGIGEFIARNPRYRFLFGPVSISSAYRISSQKLLIDYLAKKHSNAAFTKLVRPRNFKKKSFKISPLVKKFSIEFPELDDMISDIEKDGMGIPILIKQYLKLGAKFISFNLDPDFNDALDGLILVDLYQTDPQILGRYMGKENADLFRKYHDKRNDLINRTKIDPVLKSS